MAALFCATTSLSALADDIIVTTRDGGRVVYSLSEKPVVTFTDSDVVLTTTKATVSYALAENPTFTYSLNDDVQAIAGLKAVVTCDGTTVDISHAVPGTTVSMYDTNGRLLHQVAVSADGTATIALGGKGVYIIKTDSLTIKIAN